MDAKKTTSKIAVCPQSVGIKLKYWIDILNPQVVQGCNNLLIFSLIIRPVFKVHMDVDDIEPVSHILETDRRSIFK